MVVREFLSYEGTIGGKKCEWSKNDTYEQWVGESHWFVENVQNNCFDMTIDIIGQIYAWLQPWRCLGEGVCIFKLHFGN